MKKLYSLGLYEKALPPWLDWRGKLYAAAEAGYDFLEISIDESEEKLARLYMTAKERRELIELTEEAGLPIRTMCLSGHRKFPIGSADPKIRARGMEIMERAVALADSLGVRIIQMAGYDVYYEASTPETKALFEENLKKAVGMAAEAGVMLGFETMETEFMNTVEKAMYYVQKLRSPYLNIYPDMGNITNAAALYGKNVLDDLHTGWGHLTSVHLKETLPGKYREIPFGKGHVEFGAVIREAWRMGVRKYVTEFWYTGSSDWKEELRRARIMMGGYLDRECRRETEETGRNKKDGKENERAC